MEFTDTVVTASNGEQKRAKVAKCSTCGNETWAVFQIEGQTHLHLSCEFCGTSYCPDGACQ